MPNSRSAKGTFRNRRAETLRAGSRLEPHPSACVRTRTPDYDQALCSDAGVILAIRTMPISRFYEAL